MSNKTYELAERKNTLFFPKGFWNLFRLFASYRSAMRIKEAMIFNGENIYYCCPRCSITLDREFVSFCDRCGQKLDWTLHKKAKLLYPLSKRKIKGSSKDIP